MAKTYNYFHDSTTKPQVRNKHFIRFDVRTVAMAIAGNKEAEDSFETILAILQNSQEDLTNTTYKLNQVRDIISQLNKHI